MLELLWKVSCFWLVCYFVGLESKQEEQVYFLGVQHEYVFFFSTNLWINDLKLKKRDKMYWLPVMLMQRKNKLTLIIFP